MVSLYRDLIKCVYAALADPRRLAIRLTRTAAAEGSRTGLASLRRLATDPEFLWRRLMFTKSLETAPLLGMDDTIVQ